jgi:hypothetical protein
LATKTVDGGWRDYFFELDDLDVESFIAEHADENCYFCPHLFRQPRRVKANAVCPQGLWADLDGVYPSTLRELKPTIAIRSSCGRFVGLWCTDTVVSEALNKRLTYATGADKGGWDLTQVLRLPGSVNWKYTPPPRVVTLWTDGPRYRVAELEKILPALPERGNGHGVLRRASELTPVEILAKHDIRGWLRQQLLHGRQRSGERRHRMHWRLACQLKEHGVGAAEAFVCLRDTRWNKHATDAPVWALVDKLWSE